MGLFKSKKKDELQVSLVEQMQILGERMGIELNSITVEEYVLETFGEKPKTLTIREAVKFDKDERIKKLKNSKIIARADFNQIDKMFQEIENQTNDGEVIKLAKGIHQKSLKKVKKTEYNYSVEEYGTSFITEFEWSKTERKYIPTNKIDTKKEYSKQTQKLDSSTKTIKKATKTFKKVSKKSGVGRKPKFQ